MFLQYHLLAVALLSVAGTALSVGNECCEKQLNVAYIEAQNKKYHVVFNFKENYFTAAEYCRNIGMDLASIETAVQQNVLWNYITSLGLAAEHFWIAGSDLGHEGRFVWLNTGLPLIYSNFMSNQPDNASGNENCLELRVNGKWNDLNCLLKNYFVCQF